RLISFYMRGSTLTRLAGGLSRQMSSSSAAQEAYLDADNCLVVDESDRIVGGATKRQAHHRSTVQLHRAFSVFAFTPDRQLILQKRAATKVTFPLLWTNTCCSHPLTGMRPDETDGVGGVLRAATRKLDHELNLAAVSEDQLLFMGRYLYKAAPPELEWVEHELDYALILRGIDRARVASPNDDEVEQVRCVDERELEDWIKKEPTSFTPWIRHFIEIGVLSKWWSVLDDKEKLQKMSSDKIVKMN
ncbi:idi-1, partial [Pristionchus pacificus]